MTRLEAGMDPHLVADRTRSAHAEVAAAQRLLASAGRPHDVLTVEPVTEGLRSVGSSRHS